MVRMNYFFKLFLEMYRIILSIKFTINYIVWKKKNVKICVKLQKNRIYFTLLCGKKLLVNPILSFIKWTTRKNNNNKKDRI